VTQANGRRPPTGRALVLHPALRTERGSAARSVEARLGEAVGLARAIDLDVVASRAITVARPRPATLFGTGQVAEIGEQVAADQADLVIVDGPVTPVQQRNLERAWKAKVIDRTGLILEIFGERAQTREGSLQVELAALGYQRTRLVRSWTHLERQRGGFGFLGGPGESQLEIDRRLIDERIARIKRELITVTRTRGLHRKARGRVPYPVVALVGYTNAGKSTLFNRLTKAEVTAADMLFATLDPTMRAVVLPSRRRAILSDTVGFISHLPTQLVAAFRATLEEVLAADLILHVRDIADPDSDAQKADVEAVLGELGVDYGAEGRMIEVLNKIDLLAPEERGQNGGRHAIPVSALTGEGTDVLLKVIDRALGENRRVVRLSLPLSDGAAIAWLYSHGEVVAREDDAQSAHIAVGLEGADLARFRQRFPHADSRNGRPD
jgi:GTPase